MLSVGFALTAVFPFLRRSSDEVLHILGNILAALQRGRTSLVTPKKKPIDELMKSRNMVRTPAYVAHNAYSG